MVLTPSLGVASGRTVAGSQASTLPTVRLARVDPSTLRFDPAGLIPAIVQQHDTGEVLMLAWMTADTLAETLRLGETVFWSRSRGERWHKGATSGNTQTVVAVVADCDGDTLLVRVDQGGDGTACHTGARSCFGDEVASGTGGA
jgi:phosphoribosyl-AMP cyclohydrolase